jgi:hypothetical protein
LSCAFVSCGSKESDSDTSSNSSKKVVSSTDSESTETAVSNDSTDSENTETVSKSDSTVVSNDSESDTEKNDSYSVVGEWGVDKDTYEGFELEGMVALSIKEVFNEDETCELSMILDSSDFMCLEDNKIVIDGLRCKISSYDRQNLVIRDGDDEYTFVRTSESADKYGEYTFPEELGFPEGSTIVFVSSGVSKVKIVFSGTYEYKEDTNEIRTILDEEDEDKDSYAKVEFEGNDKMIIHKSDGKTTTLTRIS